jgi:hypothetical protein
MNAGDVIQLEDGSGHRLLAVLSPSGTLIVTVATTNWQRLARIELQPEQAEELSEFLSMAAARA